MQELTQSRALAIVIDRPVERGVEATFFGQRTRVPSGSAALAVNTGAAIMPGYMWYAVNNRFYLRAFPPMSPRSLSDRAERREEIKRLTQYMLSGQEEVVRSCPTQWFMFRSFWVAGSLSSGIPVGSGRPLMDGFARRLPVPPNHAPRRVDEPTPGALANVGSGAKPNGRVLLSARSDLPLDDGPTQVLRGFPREVRVAGADVLPEMRVAGADFGEAPLLVGCPHDSALRRVGGARVIHLDPVDGVPRGE
jgi:hypothetical protein